MFYQRNQVVMMVNALPDDEFNQGPTVHKEQSGSRMKDLSAAEKAKLNKYAKALIMSDNRKAAAIGDYVKAILKKDIVPPPCPMPEDNNCVFRAFFQQMPNHDYFFNQETGEVYSANDLRNQLVAFCVTNAQAMLAKLKPQLDMPFKTWLLLQLDPQQESDSAIILALRHLIKVSRSILQLIFVGHDWLQICAD